MAQFTITVGSYANLPATQVGDGSTTTDYGSSIIYTRAMFTTNTVPPYSDPEGDAALNLKVLTLPSDGELQLDSVAVIINQIISFSNIDLGLLTYVPDNANQNAYNVTFDFQIADAGSGIFVG